MKRYKLYRDRKACTCTRMEMHTEGPWVRYSDIGAGLAEWERRTRELESKNAILSEALRLETANKAGGERCTKTTS